MTFDLIIAIAMLCNLSTTTPYTTTGQIEIYQLECRKEYFDCMKNKHSKNADGLRECMNERKR